MKRTLFIVLALVFALAGCRDLAGVQEMAEGDTNFTNVVTSGYITVGTDLTIGDDTAFGDDVAITGDLAVGNGTPSVTQDGEDAYVEGQFEVDGEAQFDGAIDANSTSDFGGAMVLSGTTPKITIGDAGAEDTTILFDGNAQDFYIALDDSADDLLIGLGATVGTTPILGADENLAIATYGDITMGGTTPVLTVGDAGAEDTTVLFDGNAQDFYLALDDSADDIVLGLGAAVGTTPILSGDENQNLTTYADLTMTGTTPQVTIGDAGAEDTAIIFDGNAQDFYVALDDSADDLLIGLGNVVGTTPALAVDENLATTTGGDVNVKGATPSVTIGDEAEEDNALYFDGNAQNYYLAQQDSSDDLILGLGLTVGTTGILYADENLDVGIGGASAGSKLDVTGNALVDGAADEVQLTVQANGTQTAQVLVVENSSGTDQFTVSNTGAVAANSATIAGDVTVSTDATGGDAGAKAEISGLPRIKFVALSTMTNGSTESANYMDDSPTGEWSEVDGGTNIVVSAGTDHYRVGANALKIAFTDVVVNEGVIGTAGAQDNLSSNESIGFWVYADAAVSAGDFNLVVDDSDGTDQTYDIGAITASIWTWKEMDISGCDANCDTMDNIKILATAQGGTTFTTLNLWFDFMWKWDAADEEALSTAILNDGVLSVMTIPTLAGSPAVAADGTDYITHYESGSDFLVTVSDQSANSGLALIAY